MYFVHGGEHSVENVVVTFEFMCSFEGDEVEGAFDDADGAEVSAWVGADFAAFGFTEVKTGLAFFYTFF